MAAAAPSCPADLPIPRDVAPGAGWTAEMREMADHIGAYDVLLLCDRHGGQRFYIPAAAERNPFRDVLGDAKAATFTRIYGGGKLTIAKADYALARARRAPLIAAVRAGMTTASQAARILGVHRDYVARLANRSDEGRGADAFASGAAGAGRKVDPRQLDMFAVARDASA